MLCCSYIWPNRNHRQNISWKTNLAPPDPIEKSVSISVFEMAGILNLFGNVKPVPWCAANLMMNVNLGYCCINPDGTRHRKTSHYYFNQSKPTSCMWVKSYCRSCWIISNYLPFPLGILQTLPHKRVCPDWLKVPMLNDLADSACLKSLLGQAKKLNLR